MTRVSGSAPSGTATADLEVSDCRISPPLPHCLGPFLSESDLAGVLTKHLAQYVGASAN